MGNCILLGGARICRYEYGVDREGFRYVKHYTTPVVRHRGRQLHANGYSYTDYMLVRDYVRNVPYVITACAEGEPKPVYMRLKLSGYYQQLLLLKVGRMYYITEMSADALVMLYDNEYMRLEDKLYRQLGLSLDDIYVLLRDDLAPSLNDYIDRVADLNDSYISELLSLLGLSRDPAVLVQLPVTGVDGTYALYKVHVCLGGWCRVVEVHGKYSIVHARRYNKRGLVVTASSLFVSYTRDLVEMGAIPPVYVEPTLASRLDSYFDEELWQEDNNSWVIVPDSVGAQIYRNSPPGVYHAVVYSYIGRTDKAYYVKATPEALRIIEGYAQTAN